MEAVSAALHPAELKLLWRLARSAARRRLPVLHVRELVRRGFATLRAGALMVTSPGYAKLVVELTRASWLAVPA